MPERDINVRRRVNRATSDTAVESTTRTLQIFTIVGNLYGFFFRFSFAGLYPSVSLRYVLPWRSSQETKTKRVRRKTIRVRVCIENTS